MDIGYWIYVLGAGLALGAFTSRFLAENFYHALPGLNSLPQTTLLSLAVTLALIAFWRLYSATCARRGKTPLHQTLADDALTYTPLFLLLFYLIKREVNPLQARSLLWGSLLLVIALKVKALLRKGIVGQRLIDRAIPASLFALTFVVYLSTLSPTLGEADSFEFQVVSYTLGIAHPTGYPLYILLGKLFTLLPISNVAYRVNLISPLFASLAVVCLYLCLVHLTRHRAISLLAALTFAFSRTFWSQAVIAEVYTLNVFFVALVLYLLLKRIGESANRRIGDIAFVYGLSLTNHLTMILLAPAIAIYALLNKRCFFANLKVTGQENGETPPLARGRQGGGGFCDAGGTPSPGPSLRGRGNTLLAERSPSKKILTAAGLFLLGLSAYLYIPLRWPALHDGRPVALGEFANWVLGSRFRGALHWDAWLKDPERYRIIFRLLLEQFGWVGLILGLLGLVWLLAPQKLGGMKGGRKEAVLLLVAYLAYFIYGLNYYVPDISAFIIPAHLLFAIWIGAGLHALWQAASSRVSDACPEPGRRVRYWILDSLLITCFSLLVTFLLLCTNLPQVDMSHRGWEAYRWGQYVLGLDIASGAAILADSEKIAPLYYLQRVEGIRSDLDIIVMGDEAGYRQQLETRLAQGQPVYLARYLPGLEGQFHLRSLGPLVEVGTTTLTQEPTIKQSLSTDFSQSIRLLGYNADSLTIEPPGHLRLTLFWQALDKADDNYHIRLRLVGESGHVWLEEEGRHPVNGYYPVVAWRPGEIVPDFHELAISRALPPGTYRLEVGLFPPFGEEAISIDQIGHVHVLEGAGWESPEEGNRRLHAIPYPLRASFADELILLGYDQPSFVRPNGQATLSLYWQRLREGNTNYDIALRTVDENGKVVWQESLPPLFGEHPTSRWEVGQIVQTSHDLTMPATAGEVGLLVGLSLPDSDQMLPVRSHWLATASEWCPLRSIQIRSTPPAGGPAVNFDNRILLLGYDLDPSASSGHRRRELRPGEALELSLTWQCLKRMDEDYTVFVHILDKEQQIWGQEDVWPVHGTYPTSQWKEGEIIEDIHSVRLSYEAPPGEYQIEVGLYLLSTMARLRVLDEEMRVVDDKVIIKMTNGTMNQ